MESLDTHFNLDANYTIVKRLLPGSNHPGS